ncbi:MAG TPA: class I SAM-dependent methyltransferase [Stackebrandtia sp.]|jgi:SAM-dependent methyltransferase|uniref:class I SAM-dependent methyltransferase n=1 Tax=Stackebrandtia sp. TaxID=2023065 RepID=UPI002D423881|nr:class I SAM-dependent methyltransferase [Stackebrandtia sp.]HZE39124.1 class I SAM-dependent methyltransferase [Stackebrandtia sp.]
MDPLFEMTAHNRVQWNAIAPDRRPMTGEFFAAGGTTLDECEVAAAGDVAGLRLLHLQCANGNESLSWAVRGARVVGVDISDVAIDLARGIARDAGLDVRFLAADVYGLPPGLGAFDMVYASAGAVCWMPDLGKWAEIVAHHLVPGGRFVLYEHHPIWEALTVDGDRLKVGADYFGRNRSRDTHGVDVAKLPVGWRSDSAFVSFIWPVSDVVTALISAGLCVERLEEHPVPGMYAGLGETASQLPATYLIIATK